MAEDIIHLAADLYAFVLDTEPIVEADERRCGPTETLRERAAHLTERFVVLRSRATAGVAKTFNETTENLKALTVELAKKRPHMPELQQRWISLCRNYEAIVAHIGKLRVGVPKGVRLGHVKPRNYHRNLFHVGNGLFGIALYEGLGQAGPLLVGGALLVCFVVLDVLRRVHPASNGWLMRHLFGKIARPAEAHRVPAATWYLVALLIGVLALPRHAIELGALVLAFGDPAASLAGKRWGRRKVLGEKSLVGCATFALVSLAVGVGFLAWARPDLAWAARIGVAAAVALTGALTELGSDRLDDNFTIPLCAGGVAALLL